MFIPQCLQHIKMRYTN